MSSQGKSIISSTKKRGYAPIMLSKIICNVASKSIKPIEKTDIKKQST
jgi:hypothetical protein